MPINKKDYPEDWPEIRQRILKRDNYKCRHCGLAQYSVGYRRKEDKQMEVLVVGENYREANRHRLQLQGMLDCKLIVIRLTIAHLDHDEWNHDVEDDRLASLCEKDHFDYDRKDNELRKKYGRHYKRHQLELL